MEAQVGARAPSHVNAISMLHVCDKGTEEKRFREMGSEAFKRDSAPVVKSPIRSAEPLQSEVLDEDFPVPQLVAAEPHDVMYVFP